MTNHPPCPHCGGATHEHGLTTAGNTRYYCPNCNRAFTPRPAKRGRPMVGDAPLTPAEKMRRSRAKKKMLG